MSADGAILSGRGVQTTPTTLVRALRWSEPSGFVSIGTLPDREWSEATGISAGGAAIIGTAFNSTIPAPAAFRWTQSEGMMALGFLPGRTSSRAEAVAADGRTIVGVSLDTGPDGWFRWTEAGGMLELTPPTSGVFNNRSLLSADGGTVVLYGTGGTYRWRESTGFELISNLFQATGISADGSVIVGTGFVDGRELPVIWSEPFGIQNLRGVMLSAGFDPAEHGLSDVFVQGMAALSTPGSITLFGSALSQDGTARYGFTATNVPLIPSPGLAGLAAAAGVWAARRRHRVFAPSLTP